MNGKTYGEPYPEERVYSSRDDTTTRLFGPFNSVAKVCLIKCQGDDEETKDSVHVVLYWSAFAIGVFHEMDEGSKTALCSVEGEQYDSQFLSIIIIKSMHVDI